MSDLSALVSDISKHRDKRSLFYKPVCAIAALDLLNSGSASPDRIKPKLVLDHFSELLSHLFSGAGSRAYLPFWHLATQGFWELYSGDDSLIGDAGRSDRRPGSSRRLQEIVAYAKPTEKTYDLFHNPDLRAQAIALFIDILASDEDDTSNVIAALLRARVSTGNLADQLILYDSNEAPNALLEDYSKFYAHLVIDRSSSKKVKDVLGYKCKLCGLDFEKVYGEIGKGYIEAHHLKPVGSHKGEVLKLDISTDFSVLCSNCHRMIHRSGCVHSIDDYIKVHGKPCYIELKNE